MKMGDLTQRTLEASQSSTAGAHSSSPHPGELRGASSNASSSPSASVSPASRTGGTCPAWGHRTAAGDSARPARSGHRGPPRAPAKGGTRLPTGQAGRGGGGEGGRREPARPGSHPSPLRTMRGGCGCDAPRGARGADALGAVRGARQGLRGARAGPWGRSRLTCFRHPGLRVARGSILVPPHPTAPQEEPIRWERNAEFQSPGTWR